MTLYYIEPVTIPAHNAHSIQINTNCEELSKQYKDFLLISYKDSKEQVKYKQKSFQRSSFFNKIIPLATFDLIKKTNKYFTFNKDKDYLLTRNPFIAWYYRNKFKKIILELHNLPQIFPSFFYYIVFDMILYDIPLRFIKNSKNVKIGVISNGIKSDLIKSGYNSKNIFTIPDGVDINKFDTKISKKDARKKLNLPQNNKIVMYTGTFQNWKGYDTLLKASDSFDKNTQLIMIGANQTQIDKLKPIYPKVLFKSFVNPDLIPIYLKAADILVIPNSAKYKISSKYTSPLKLFEYMGSKRPIVASNLPSIKEIVSKDEVVFARPDDSKDLGKKINILLNNLLLQNTLTKNAYNKVKDYTWEKRSEKILEEFNF